MFVRVVINTLKVYFQNGSLGHGKEAINTEENNNTFLLQLFMKYATLGMHIDKYFSNT